MHFSEELNMANSSTNQESQGEKFVHRVASSGLVLKFKVDKYETFPSESTTPWQEVRSSDKGNARDPLDNFVINCAQNVIPSLEQSQISNMETKDELPLFENAKVAHPDQGINRAAMVDNSTIIVEQIVSLESIEVDNGAIRESSPEDLMVRATENGSGYGSEVHICDQCGKSFNKLRSLNVHMRMTLEEPIPVEVSHTMDVSLPISNKKKESKFKHICGASKAALKMSMPSGWHPEHGTATIDLSASDSTEQSTWKFVCDKCNKRFPTGQSQGGHKRKHWWEEFRMTPLTHEAVLSFGPVVLPTDKNKKSPVLLVSDYMQPTRTGLVVASATVHPPLPQQANSLGNETELPSGFAKSLVDTTADLPAPMRISPAERCVFDLNMLAHDTIDREP